jgi:hypothetical protein
MFENLLLMSQTQIAKKKINTTDGPEVSCIIGSPVSNSETSLGHPKPKLHVINDIATTTCAVSLALRIISKSIVDTARVHY